LEDVKPLATLFARPRRGAVDAPLLDAAEIAALAQRAGGAALPPTREVEQRRLGEARSRRRGGGMDYEESRPFQPGDDARLMDWRLTARAGQPYVKIFREERRPLVFVLVDRRAAMRFGTRVRLKAAQAARAAALIAFAAQRRQAAIAGLLLEDSPHWLAPSATADAALHLAQAAARSAPPLAADTAPGLRAMLSRLAESLPRGSELWLLSDFHDLDAGCRPLLLQLASEHQLRAVQVLDPAELALPLVPGLRLYPPGGGAGVAADAAAGAYATAAAAWLEERRVLFSGLDIPYRLLLTDNEAIERELPL
jgi:uncharacterized protein (DUF58 family)